MYIRHRYWKHGGCQTLVHVIPIYTKNISQYIHGCNDFKDILADFCIIYIILHCVIRALDSNLKKVYNIILHIMEEKITSLNTVY